MHTKHPKSLTNRGIETLLDSEATTESTYVQLIKI